MKLGRRMGWLGWIMAAVIAVSAGGAVLAAGTSQDPSASGLAVQHDTKGKPGTQGLPGRAFGLGGQLARRMLHGDATVRTKDGFKQIVVARGKVTAVSDTSLTIQSEDGVSTTFALTADTKFGTRRHPQTRADVKVGDRAGAIAVKSGGANQARRVVDLAARPQGGGQGSTP